MAKRESKVSPKATEIPFRARPAVPFQTLFNLEDFHAAVAASGLRVCPGAQPSLIVQAMDRATLDVLSSAYYAHKPGNFDRSRYFKRLASAAERLLKLLDDRENVRTIVADLKVPGAMVGHGPGINQLLREASTLPESWLQDGLGIAAPLSHDQEMPAGLSREFVNQQVNAVSSAVATVLLLAEHSSRIKISGASDIGRKPDAPMDTFFEKLAHFFFATFGCAPETDSDRTDSTNGSLRWVIKIIACLNQRADNFRIRLFSHDADVRATETDRYRAIIRTAYGLAPSTKADRLAEGWRRWVRREQEAKWLAEHWYPYGTNDPNARGVPEWLRDKAISTP